jgi:hypothetical protein
VPEGVEVAVIVWSVGSGEVQAVGSFFGDVATMGGVWVVGRTSGVAVAVEVAVDVGGVVGGGALVGGAVDVGGALVGGVVDVGGALVGGVVDVGGALVGGVVEPGIGEPPGVVEPRGVLGVDEAGGETLVAAGELFVRAPALLTAGESTEIVESTTPPIR